jgi:hypothetical protein
VTDAVEKASFGSLALSPALSNHGLTFARGPLLPRVQLLRHAWLIRGWPPHVVCERFEVLDNGAQMELIARAGEAP